MTIAHKVSATRELISIVEEHWQQ